MHSNVFVQLLEKKGFVSWEDFLSKSKNIPWPNNKLQTAQSNW